MFNVSYGVVFVRLKLESSGLIFSGLYCLGGARSQSSLSSGLDLSEIGGTQGRLRERGTYSSSDYLWLFRIPLLIFTN